MTNVVENDYDDVEEIDLTILIKDYLKVFSKMLIPIIILIVIITGVCVTYSYVRYKPKYKAYLTYAININDGSSSKKRFYNNSTAEQMAKTFPHIITSELLQRKVAADMGRNEIPGAVTATVEPNTNFLTIEVTSNSPENAYDILNSVVRNYPSVSEVIVGKIDMELLDESGIPKEPYNKRNIKIIAGRGVLIGIGLGLIWVLFITLTRHTIRQEDQCLKYLNMRCIGNIPLYKTKLRSKKEKTKINISDESISDEFSEAFRILRNKVEYSAKKNNIKVLIVTSSLAGEGKSTISTNLAIALAMEHKKVTLIDCDLRHPSIGEILECNHEFGLIDYLKGKVPIQKCIVKKFDKFKHKLPFVFIPGGKAVSDGSRYLANEKMRYLIECVKRQSDYVILDTAPAGLMTDAGILSQLSDGLVYVVKNDYACVDQIIDGLESMTKSDIHVIGCVLNENL